MADKRFGWQSPSMTDPAYLRGHSELPYVYHSTDDSGGTYFAELKPIAQSAGRSGPIKELGYANYPYFTGGTFLRPQFLPPVRVYKLQ